MSIRANKIVKIETADEATFNVSRETELVEALFHAGATYEGDIFTIEIEHLEDAKKDLTKQLIDERDEDEKANLARALMSIEFIQNDMGDDTVVEYLCF